MSNPRLRDLQRRLRITPSAPAQPAATADGLAAAIEALVAQEIAKALGTAQPKPPEAPRLHDLTRKLAQAMPASVNPPSRPLRELFDIPPETQVSDISAAELIAPKPAPAAGKPPPLDFRVTARDGNGRIAVMTASVEGRPDSTFTVSDRDANGHLAAIRADGPFGQRTFRVAARDANGFIERIVAD